MRTRFSKALTTLSLAATGVIILAIAASAQAVRYVSSNGANANPCTREAPCRNLQRGIKATPAGGELQILDSGTYGNVVTIGKSITITADGVSATVGAITIDAPGDTVVLRGLRLSGNDNPEASGISVFAAATVHIAGCEIERFSGVGNSGISLTGDNVEMFVSDTIVRRIGSSGLFLDPAASGARLTIANSRFENNAGTGIFVGGDAEVAIAGVVVSGGSGHGISNGPGRVSIASTTAANNLGAGFATFAGGQMTIDSSVASGNGGAGVLVNGGVGRVTNSAFTTNNVGLAHVAGTLESRGDNMVRGNVSAQTQGTITVIPGI